MSAVPTLTKLMPGRQSFPLLQFVSVSWLSARICAISETADPAAQIPADSCTPS